MILFLFFIGHFIGDFTLQTEYMALGKNKYNPLPNTSWYWPMLAHNCTHGIIVFGISMIMLSLYSLYPIIVIMNISMIFCLLEIVLHFVIDTIKCKKVINYNIDQFLHLFCKIIWFILLLIIV